MRRSTACLMILGFFLIVAAPTQAEDEAPPPMVAKVYFANANPGQALEFEAAYTNHVKWHAEMKDDWYWHTWQITNGRNMGQYLVRTGDHAWSDFDGRDDFQKQDSAHFNESVARFVHDLSSVLMVAAPNITKWPEDLGIPKMVEVSVFTVHDEAADTFYHAISKIHEAIIEKEIPFTYSWAWVANGMDGPTWVLVVPFESWAEYGAMFDIPFWQKVEEAFGEYETNQLKKMWSKSVASQDSYIAAYRPDMSYNPPKQE